MGGLTATQVIPIWQKQVKSMLGTGGDRSEDYLTMYDSVSSALPALGINWLDNHRREALIRFGQMGLPKTKDEHWKYTDVRSIARKSFRPQMIESQFDETLINNLIIPGIESHLLLFLDGRWIPQMSRCDALPKGVMVRGLAETLDQSSQRIKDKLGKALQEPTHGFNAINSAFVFDGAFIEIDPDVRLDKPIECVYISSAQEDLLVLPRNLVWLHTGSEATLIERYSSLSPTSCLTSAVSEVVIEDEAKLNFVKFQDESLKSFHIGGSFFEVGREAHLSTTTITFGGALVRNDLNVNLNGAGSQVGLNGLYVGDKSQHIDNDTRVSHNASDTTSHQVYRGILDGSSRGVFRGHIEVKPNAQQTNAAQENHNLMLSRQAEADSMPQLEIYADDVRCAHGATIGQLDDELVFYLQSRGIKKLDAKKILTQAFAKEVLNKLEPASFRKYLNNRFEEVLVKKNEFFK